MLLSSDHTFPRVILLGNYPADGQQSMLRYAEGLESGLRARGVKCEIWSPRIIAGRLASKKSRFFKWLAYLDKYALFPLSLWWRLAGEVTGEGGVILHICDHSNSPWAFFCRDLPVVTTCHDAGAIRGAIGELDDCRASVFGKILQRFICAGLRKSARIPCVSDATRQDVLRLVIRENPSRVTVIHNGFNRPIGKITQEKTVQLIREKASELLTKPFLLHVGSGLERKNRAGTLRVFHEFRKTHSSRLVFAGEPLSAEIKELITSLGLSGGDVVSVVDVSDDLLEALYKNAYALLFPTRFEGFGWPVIEAQACGCPVLTTNVSALPEVAGEGALIRSPLDEGGFVSDLLSLRDEAVRSALIRRGYENAARFSLEKMTDEFISVYREMQSLRT